MESSMSAIPVQQVARAIHGEYLEMPGLSLTCQQVQRLYSLDALTSESILAALVDLQFLARTATGRYVRTGRTDGSISRPTKLQGRAA
jgi:hypothetical protein